VTASGASISVGSYKTADGLLSHAPVVTQLLALLGFSFVSSFTPGPNNILLWASGATFGFRRTVPHVLGTALGIGAMALAAGFGVAALIASAPVLGIAMRAAGSAYLLWLAWQILRLGALDQADVARPLSLGGAMAFQVVNPKAWIFALGAVTTFRPAELPIVAGTLLVALAMMSMIVPTASAWAAAGGAMAGWLSGERTRRVVSVVLAAMVVATVALVWI
jgi:threonine/homoserine/homoserine lactone efflux protein